MLKIIPHSRRGTFTVLSLGALTLLAACRVGPDYARPPVAMPAAYKEAARDWKLAQPGDTGHHGRWWTVFHDNELNALEVKLASGNQSIAAAYAQYQQARALVAETRAGYFPALTTALGVTRQRTVTNTGNAASSSTGTANPGNSHAVTLDATWEPDLWGGVRQQNLASASGAQASLANVAAVRLAAQATLAQDYFALRALDNDQQILADTVRDDKRALAVTHYRYTAGVAAQADVVQAKTQLESAVASAWNNQNARAQYEHAIAVLLAHAPAEFTLAARVTKQRPPQIPLSLPSALLERRPDVAQAERLMAQANAQIGVAVTAYFPVLTLSGSANLTQPGFAHWFSVPDLAWALGTQVAQTLLDGGLRRATVKAAQANYQATVANYKQTVLTALQNVEDALAQLRILAAQSRAQDKAAADAKNALKLVINQYKAGTVVYTDVITAQNTAYLAQQTAVNVHGAQMAAAVSLIKALGGGWDNVGLATALS